MPGQSGGRRGANGIDAEALRLPATDRALPQAAAPSAPGMPSPFGAPAPSPFGLPSGVTSGSWNPGAPVANPSGPHDPYGPFGETPSATRPAPFRADDPDPASRDAVDPDVGDLDSEPTRIEAAPSLSEEATVIRADTAPAPFLRVEQGADAGKEYAIRPGDTTIGRGVDNDIVLGDISVSRRHLRIVSDGSILRSIDLGSGNGTSINGVRQAEMALQPGDRVRIGETTMVVCVPGALPSAPTAPRPAIPVMSTGDMMAAADTHLPTARVMSATATATIPMVRRLSPKAWMLLAAASIFGFLLVVGAVVVVYLITNAADDDVVANAAQDAPMARRYADGEAAFAARRWDAAEAQFSQILRADPGHQGAQQYLERIRDAREHEQLIAAARQALERDEPTAALQLSASIPSSSPVQAEVEALRTDARARLLVSLERDARAAIEADDRARAQQLLETMRTLAPDDPKIAALAAELANLGDPEGEAPRHSGSGGSSHRDHGARGGAVDRSAGAGSSQPAPRDRGGSGGANADDRVLSLYRQGSFSSAVDLARREAASQTGADRNALMRLGDRIERFARDYEASRRGAAQDANGLRAMESAVALDERISDGHYARQLRPRLLEAHISMAQRALAANNPAQGCRSVQQATALGGRTAALRSLAQRCEREAATLVSDARSLEERDRTRAMAIYRQVMTMVPSTSGQYREAYRRLNSLAR